MDVTTWIIHLSFGPGGISVFCVKSQFYISHYFRNGTLAHYQLFSSVVYIAIWTGKCSRSRVYTKRQALLGVLLWTMLQIQLLHKVSKRFSYPSQAKRNFYKRFERTSSSRYLEYGDLRSAWCVCETEKSAWKRREGTRITQNRGTKILCVMQISASVSNWNVHFTIHCKIRRRTPATSSLWRQW